MSQPDGNLFARQPLKLEDKVTMPDERTRSIRWGGELLAAIANDLEIDEITRGAALRLLTPYPTPEQILRWIEDGVFCLPSDAAESLAAAAELFNRLQFSRQGTSETRHDLMYTRRHFPGAQDALAWGRGARQFSIRTWLMPDDSYSGGPPP